MHGLAMATVTTQKLLLEVGAAGCRHRSGRGVGGRRGSANKWGKDRVEQLSKISLEQETRPREAETRNGKANQTDAGKMESAPSAPALPKAY